MYVHVYVSDMFFCIHKGQMMISYDVSFGNIIPHFVLELFEHQNTEMLKITYVTWYDNYM